MPERAERQIAGILLATLGVVALLVGVGRYGTWQNFVNAGESPTVTVTWDRWLLLQASAAHRLMGMLILPVGQTVDYDYDILPQPRSGLMGLGTLGLLGLMALLARRRWPLVTFGVFWTLIVIAPRLILQTPRSQLNEHQMYLAIVGFAMMCGGLWHARTAHGKQ